MSPRALMMFKGSIPSSAPRVFSSEGFTEKRKTSAIDTTPSAIPHVGTPAKMPTIELVMRYMKTSTPAQPSSASAVESGNLHAAFQRRASARCDAPIVKHRSIMFW